MTPEQANETTQDPKTLAEWQDAADQAHFFLALDSARQYGLVETDIGVDVERCRAIIRRAKEIGITPAPVSLSATRLLGKGRTP